MVYLAAAILVGQNNPDANSLPLLISASALIALSLLMFFVIVLLMPFRDNQDFRLDAKRLLLDTLVSSLFCIVSFSLLYRSVGLSHGGADILPDPVTALYFSSVTFSTLGYGDFSPKGDWRLIASTQALIGNLHLGMVVGSTFAAIRD